MRLHSGGETQGSAGDVGHSVCLPALLSVLAVPPVRASGICCGRASRLAGWEDRRVSEWVLFMHPPRDDFIATMTDAERAAFVTGPCLGQVNTGRRG